MNVRVQDLGSLRDYIWKAEKQFDILQGYTSASGSQCNGAMTRVSVLMEHILSIFMKHLHSIITWGKVRVASIFK